MLSQAGTHAWFPFWPATTIGWRLLRIFLGRLEGVCPGHGCFSVPPPVCGGGATWVRLSHFWAARPFACHLPVLGAGRAFPLPPNGRGPPFAQGRATPTCLLTARAYSPQLNQEPHVARCHPEPNSFPAKAITRPPQAARNSTSPATSVAFRSHALFRAESFRCHPQSPFHANDSRIPTASADFCPH
jgi:hypothetical protein